MNNRSEVTNRSLLFGACVLIGLVISYIDGVPTLEIAQTALLASVFFLAFMVCQAAMPKWRAIRKQRRRR